jgi:hypothetical protein
MHPCLRTAVPAKIAASRTEQAHYMNAVPLAARRQITPTTENVDWTRTVLMSVSLDTHKRLSPKSGADLNISMMPDAKFEGLTVRTIQLCQRWVRIALFPLMQSVMHLRLQSQKRALLK